MRRMRFRARAGSQCMFRAIGVFASAAALFAGGCTAFNPAFVNLLDPSAEAGFASIPNPAGHVVVALINNTEFDERLVNYLAPKLELSESEIRALRPRVRLRVQITFVDGSTTAVELIDGSQSFVDPNFSAEAFPDLNQNDLTNIVVECDVASVDLVPGSGIDVFVPTELVGYQLVQTTNEGGQTVTDFEERQRIAPTFRSLLADETDADGNVTLRRNIGVRDVPTPTTNVVCGSVIAITMTGVLTVPFLEGVSNAPSFDVDDEAQVARIGGRFEFNVSVQ